MKRLYEPESVLIIGVSESPSNMGRNILKNLVRFGYRGGIHLMGRKDGCIDGRRIHTGFDSLPRGIDLAVMLVPAGQVPEALGGCGRIGIRRAIVETGGFSELTGEDKALDQELLEVARRHDIRFVGPNGLGVACTRTGAVTPFMRMDSMPRVGRISLFSQSGGVGVVYLQALDAENLGMDCFVSMGNKLSIDETDYLLDAAASPHTDIACFYLEDVRRPRDFYRAVCEFPGAVIVQKANTTGAGARAASSHTAALAMDDKVLDAALRQAGALRVRTMEEMISRAMAVSLPPVRGNRMLLLSRSGGHAVIAADLAEENGFVLPDLPESMAELVRGSCRASVIRAGNPLDLGDVFDFNTYEELIRQGASGGDFDAVVMIHVFAEQAEAEASAHLLDSCRTISRETGTPVGLCFIAPPERLRSFKARTRHPVFSSPETLVDAMADSRDWHLRRSNRTTLPAPVVVGESRQQEPSLIPAAAAWSLLEEAGFPTPERRILTADEPVDDACAAVGFPAALKADSPGIAHKSDVGGVALGLASSGDVRNERREMKDRLREEGVSSFLLQAMARPGREVFLGARRDPQFGPLVLVGHGGVNVELLGDVAIRLAPLDRREAESMLDEVRFFRTFIAHRGRPAADREHLLGRILALAELITSRPDIQEIDINPYFLYDEGEGGVAVDVRVLT